MELKPTSNLTAALNTARDEAMRTGYRAISPDHLLLALLRHGKNAAVSLLERLGINISELKKEIDARIFRNEYISYDELDQIQLGNAAKSVFNAAVYEALKEGKGYASCIHLLIAIAAAKETASAEILKESGADEERIRGFAQDTAIIHTLSGAEEDRARLIADAIGDELRRSLRQGYALKKGTPS